MMNINRLLLSFLTIGLVISACKKDGSDDASLSAAKFTDIRVPEGFDWEISRDVEFSISVGDARGIEVISIFDSAGNLISKGSASANAPFTSRIYLTKDTREVFITRRGSGITRSKKVQITATDMQVDMSAAGVQMLSSTKGNVSTFSASPDCSTGCSESVTITQNGQWITVDAGKTICVSGSSKTFNVTFGTGGGTLRICGTSLSIQSVNKNAGASAIHIIVTSNSVVSMSGLDLDKSNHVIENYGELSFSGNLSSSGLVKNYGILRVNGDYNLNSGSNVTHTNEGTLTVTGTMNTNSSTVFQNNGQATLKKLQVNASSTFNNYCKLIITENTTVDNVLNNYSYAEVGTVTQINGNDRINLYDGAYFKTKDLDKIGGNFVGKGTRSLLKITGTINQNLILEANQTSNGQRIMGSIALCYGAVLPAGLFKDGAVQDCDLYIPSSGCNPGNGTATVVDTDGDGTADGEDDYPNDAGKAHNNYYPSAAENAGATVAFEDMWPYKGDYDMNDVVLSYRLKIVTNTANEVVKVEGDYNLYARGGIYQNGFGIEFPLDRGKVSNVSGATLEEGQQKAVLILFSNMQSELYYMNTRPEEPLSPTKSYHIHFDVNDGPLLSEFGLGEYNPFIWNKAAGRGYEIHLPGKQPTSLANPALFGTADDRTNPSAGKYYVTAEGYPWAISIPVKNFSYPREGVDIITAYLKLPQWIISGGENYQNWYDTSKSDYTDPSNLFNK